MIESRVFQIQSQATGAFTVMQELRLSQQLCDIVLCVGGAKFSVHRVCIQCCLFYFYVAAAELKMYGDRRENRNLKKWEYSKTST